jgi:hypothetical protein
VSPSVRWHSGFQDTSDAEASKMYNLKKPGVERPFDFGTASIDTEHARVWGFQIGQILHLKSEIRDRKLDGLRCRSVQSHISDFGFEMQDLSNFKILPKR